MFKAKHPKYGLHVIYAVNYELLPGTEDYTDFLIYDESDRCWRWVSWDGWIPQQDVIVGDSPPNSLFGM